MFQLRFDSGYQMIGAQSQTFHKLRADGLGEWCNSLEASPAFANLTKHGHFEAWQRLIASLPKPPSIAVDLQSPAVTITGDCTPVQREQIRNALMQLHPWRKGPFDIFGVTVDAEWRSDMKWDRIQPHVPWRHKNILDVGCGNGYYGYRMLGQGARSVLGLDPYPLYNAQFAIVSTFTPTLDFAIFPATDDAIDRPLDYFDVTLSMGVLYHCKDPIGHISKLRHSLAPGGTIVLETIVVEGNEHTLLLPEQRYAKMRNVWFLPSALLLERMVARVGFRNVQVVDITKTTPNEQRRTDWMTFESLSDFLDPQDPNQTIEGAPAPQRAILIAEA